MSIVYIPRIKHFPLDCTRGRGTIILEKPTSMIEKILIFPFLRRCKSYDVPHSILPFIEKIIGEEIYQEVKYKIKDLSTYERLKEVVEESV